MEVGGARGARIDISQSQTDAAGWRGQKTPWLVSRSYRGPLLIRGRHLNGSAGVRFALGYGDHRVRLFWPRIPRKNVVAGYFGLPSSVLVRQPGCYGFQIDGSTFTEHIVVRVVS
jgi:hypothetical protein